MAQKILAVCDKEEKYLYRLVECLENRELLPFTICAFTNERALRKFSSKKQIELLLIAEGCYEEEIKELPIAHILILNESGNETGEGIKNINKYQSAEGIFREIMENYMGNAQTAPKRLQSGSPMKIIGNYTPVRRCLQTTFSLTMGQILAKEHKVLYMNFESYSGLSYLLNREFSVDITDVLYYFNCEREKLVYRLAGMVQSINGMDFIPPVVSYQDLCGVTGEQWLHLFREVEASTSHINLCFSLVNSVFLILSFFIAKLS